MSNDSLPQGSHPGNGGSLWEHVAKAAPATEVPPAGPQLAVCQALIDLGTHTEDVKDKDGVTKQKDFHKTYLAFELTGCKIGGTTRNHVVGREFNISFTSNSALRKFIESWRGRNFAEGERFDIRKLLGQPCTLTIKHKPGKSRTFADIDGISLPMRGADGKPMQVPPPTRELLLYEIGSGPLPDLDWLPWSFGEPVKNIIQRSQEWKRQAGQPPLAAPSGGEVANGPDADPPF